MYPLQIHEHSSRKLVIQASEIPDWAFEAEWPGIEEAEESNACEDEGGYEVEWPGIKDNIERNGYEGENDSEAEWSGIKDDDEYHTYEDDGDDEEEWLGIEDDDEHNGCEAEGGRETPCAQASGEPTAPASEYPKASEHKQKNRTGRRRKRKPKRIEEPTEASASTLTAS